MQYSNVLSDFALMVLPISPAKFQVSLSTYIQLGVKYYWALKIGKWSAPVPKCELVKCQSLETPEALYEPHLEIEEHNNSYGGIAVFSCAWGYKLIGPPGIECELNGNWSGPLPKCVRKYGCM